MKYIYQTSEHLPSWCPWKLHSSST